MDNEVKLCSGVEAVRGFTYLGERVCACEGCCDCQDNVRLRYIECGAVCEEVSSIAEMSCLLEL